MPKKETKPWCFPFIEYSLNNLLRQNSSPPLMTRAHGDKTDLNSSSQTASNLTNWFDSPIWLSETFLSPADSFCCSPLHLYKPHISLIHKTKNKSHWVFRASLGGCPQGWAVQVQPQPQPRHSHSFGGCGVPRLSAPQCSAALVSTSVLWVCSTKITSCLTQCGNRRKLSVLWEPSYDVL